MIARLNGTIIDTSLTHVVLDVGGVGYLVAVRIPAEYTVGNTAEFHTYLAVRESALDLYGFKTRDELEMFEHLLTLPKIGPKLAMQVMSQANPELLKQSIATGDASYLSKMSGIGAKSAEKIVQGLKDVFESVDDEIIGTGVGHDGDVMDALLALGYSQRDALAAIQKLPPDITEASERIREALKQLGK